MTRMTRIRPRAAAAVPAVLAAALLLAGCGGDEPDGSAADGASAESPSAEASENPHGTTEESWNPCTGLRVDKVSAALGSAVTADAGTDDAPRCALLPAADGGPVLDVNYMVFPDGLDAAWETMGAPDDGSADVTDLEVPGAEAARVVVNRDDGGATITGFVQNGSLIHVVNAADTTPYDAKALLRGVRTVLSQVSAHAEEAGELTGTE